jgi:hypothetical protein
LHAEFPSLTFVELPGYDVKFDKNRAFTIFRLIFSIPKILIRIKREKAWLKHFSLAEKPDLVISDNRYGMVCPGIPSVFVTHQLLVRTPFGPGADRILQRINYHYIHRFSNCWIPDTAAAGGPGDNGGLAGDDGLAGELSHPARMPAIQHRYIGWLSRFGDEPRRPAGTNQDYILALLSGPEPQRTMLEKIILEQASSCPHPLTLVRGLPQGGTRLSRPPEGMITHDHLPAAELGPLIRDAALVIARPGYSSLMDLARLKKRAVFIPTPGQTEQEYLGKRVAAKGWAVCMDQRGFSLTGALAAAQACNGWPMDAPKGDPLGAAIAEVLCCC